MMGFSLIVGLHEFFGRANDRRLEASVATHSFNLAPEGCICDVLAVPRQQLVYTIDRGNGDMECIARFRSRDGFCGNQGVCQLINVVRCLQQVEILNDLKTLSGRRWIALGAFLNDDL